MLDWNHNTYYHRLLLRRLPKRCARVLDVGCGAGAFAARLARRAGRVDALDRSAEMIELAARNAPDNVHCVLADVLADELPARDYDAIVSISTLHHLPLDVALPRLAGALRAGGVLAVIALPRTELRRELPAELFAAFAHRVLGLVFLVLRRSGTGDWFAKDAAHERMPVVLDPALTTGQVARQAAALLPGARVRRLLFWRYLLVWRKPG